MRSERLRNFCETYRGVESQWGVDDCTLFVREWVKRECGIDIVRNAYASEAEARALIAPFGNLTELWRKHLGDVGIFETFEFNAGDICTVELNDGNHIGAIIAKSGALVWRSTIGTRFLWAKSIVAAWGLPAEPADA